MTGEQLAVLLAEVRAGRLEVDAALERLRGFPMDDTVVGARVDTQRALRTGVAEVVFCAGKSADQVAQILRRLHAHHGRALGTRATPEQAQRVQERVPAVAYDPVSRLLTLGAAEAAQGTAPVAVISAGSADLPVAEEAAQNPGVSRRQRAAQLRRGGGRAASPARGAAATGTRRGGDQRGRHGGSAHQRGGRAAGGTGDRPVPTSVGYGANLGGAAALLAMLNSCAAGVSVVNIDNGFGAALMAHAIVRQIGAAAAPPDGGR